MKYQLNFQKIFTVYVYLLAMAQYNNQSFSTVVLLSAVSSFRTAVPFAARFNSTVSNLALPNSNCTCFTVKISSSFHRCSLATARRTEFSTPARFVGVCARVTVCRILLLNNISPYYDLLVKYLPSIYIFYLPHLLNTQFLKSREGQNTGVVFNTI